MHKRPWPLGLDGRLCIDGISLLHFRDHGLTFFFQRFEHDLHTFGSPAAPHMDCRSDHGIRSRRSTILQRGQVTLSKFTYQLRLAPEPECLENPIATAREDPQDGAGSNRDTQSCLWFQMIGVEAPCLRPYDRGNLSC